MGLLQRAIRSERTMRAAAPLFGRYHPWHPDVRRDPYPTYARLREERPIYKHPLLRSWVLSRHDDVTSVLRDPRMTSDRREQWLWRALRFSLRRSPALLAFTDNSLLTIDGADHGRLRGLVARAFTPRRVEALRPRVRVLVDELLDAAAAKGRIDAMADFAAPLPVVVIAELLGVPVADRAALQILSNDLVGLLDPLSTGGLGAAKRAAEELFVVFRRLVAERRSEPRDDLISAMLEAEEAGALGAEEAGALEPEEAGARLDETELLCLTALLLVAGHETTTNLLGNALLALLAHPDERKRWVEDASLDASAVEELLRFDSPVQLTDRVAAEDLEIRGARVRRGSLVGVLLGSANRDPAVFEEPDRLDLGRDTGRHLSFGLGRHFCLGSHLARLEAQEGLGRFVRRFPGYRAPRGATGWKPSIVLRGPTALPLELGNEGT